MGSSNNNGVTYGSNNGLYSGSGGGCFHCNQSYYFETMFSKGGGVISIVGQKNIVLNGKDCDDDCSLG